MINLIRCFWEDAEEIKAMGENEKEMMNKYAKLYENTILVRKNEKTYVAGRQSGDIEVIDCDAGLPFIRISGKFD